MQSGLGSRSRGSGGGGSLRVVPGTREQSADCPDRGLTPPAPPAQIPVPAAAERPPAGAGPDPAAAAFSRPPPAPAGSPAPSRPVPSPPALTGRLRRSPRGHCRVGPSGGGASSPAPRDYSPADSFHS